MTRVKFEVREIKTMPNGTVFLIGPQGVMRIKRETNSYSYASYCDNRNKLNLKNCHSCKVAEIDTKPYVNIAF